MAVAKELSTDKNGTQASTKLKTFKVGEETYRTFLNKKFEKRKTWVKPNEKEINSSIPGTILQFFVKEGQEIKTGDILIKFEAMKMENLIESPCDGKIKKIHVKVGEKIPKGRLIIDIE